MKRKLGWLMMLVAIISMLATGCGPKGVDDIVADLNTQLGKMTGYKMNAKLTLQTGKDPQTYDVEVWHNKPDFYRVALTSKERDITQIILRNEEGVFVLTPHLNKSFRFQSGWPENHAQVYLYESLVKSILNDDQRVFAEEEGKYTFEVKADYQNRSLTTQKIWLATDLSPVKVDVMDTNKNVMVTVEFANFQSDAKFDSNSFNKERNMETSMINGSVPTMANGEPAPEPKGSFGVIQPTYVPEGLTFMGVQKVDTPEGPQVVLRYQGEYSMTLIEERPKAATVSYPSGEIVDLGHTMGVMTGEQKKTLTWAFDGVEYLLTGDLPEDELISVAKSTFNQIGK
ncbi:outer membrane lipoprotein-sorting protein [Ammoniphilus sp. YIM 78166]|uniref:outer membrane lipoprotein-sorting protein n=1 Tax=Ammoniphilus sp. YIM 78166 TaxID=1644106 RepID=UPI0010700993|nr:outer membrane lipoprotein-sorting protein [Ammoniphilus sp. YIM 78166]